MTWDDLKNKFTSPVKYRSDVQDYDSDYGYDDWDPDIVYHMVAQPTWYYAGWEPRPREEIARTTLVLSACHTYCTFA